MRIFITLIILSLCANGIASTDISAERSKALLAYAQKSPRVKADYIKVTDYLVKMGESELEKAKLIYYWLCENIAYDAESFQKGKYPSTDPSVTMTNRKGVCSGYANLFHAMGKHAGLDIEVVGGYSKGYGFKQGTKFKGTDHAWNVLTIDGKKIFIDATWGAGYIGKVKSKLVFTKRLSDYWFNTNPYEAIFSHLPSYPDGNEYQLIQSKLTLKQYEDLPYIRHSFFKSGIVNASKILSDYRKGIVHNLPKTYALDVDVDILKAPLEMSKKKKYQFKIVSNQGGKLALFFKDKFLKKVEKNNNNEYVFDFTPDKKGELKISIQYPKDIDPNGMFWSAMVYDIRK